jgi:hypothetical protein
MLRGMEQLRFQQTTEGKTNPRKGALSGKDGMTRGVVGKLRRALKKAQREPTDEAIKNLYTELQARRLDPMSLTSYQLAKLFLEIETGTGS